MTRDTEHTGINNQLRQTLLTVEGKFLEAIEKGSDALSSFVTTWSTIQNDIMKAKEQSTLEQETITLANNVATNIAVLGQGFLDFETSSVGFYSCLVSESRVLMDAELQARRRKSNCSSSTSPVSLLYSRVAKPSLQAPRHPTTTPVISALPTILPPRHPSTGSLTGSSSSASDPNPLPEFIEHAYKFFVVNIFNPYPTREEKEAIVNQTTDRHVTLSSISNWFTNARRRCGWAQILKRRCDGNRDQMVDLATRVFIEPDPNHPVDPQIVKEMMEMKESLESMYEGKIRTSVWMNEIEEMEEELINPILKEDQLAKERETDAECQLRRRQREMKEQQDLERRKRKMQTEALRKAEKVAKAQHEQEKQANEDKNKESNEPLYTTLYPPAEVDDDSGSEPRLVAGGKRKSDRHDNSSYDYSAFRHGSPAYSLSSSSNSDLSSESRASSLTWSDSGDEQRPYKRSRSSSSTPYTTPSSLSPGLDITASFDYSFTCEPPTGVALFDPFLGLSVNTSENSVATLPRGQRRQHDMEDREPTPKAKRSKAVVASNNSDLALAPSTPLFTPTPGNGSPGGPASRRSSFASVHFGEVSGSDPTNPQSVQIPHLDVLLPPEIGVFWSASPNLAINLPCASGTEDYPHEYAQLFQLLTEPQQQAPVLPTFETSEHTEQQLDARLAVPSVDLQTPGFMLQQPTPTTNSLFHHEGGHNLDFGGFMSGCMSDEALNDLGMTFPDATHPAAPDLSRPTWASPAWTQNPATPSETSPTPAELAEKAMNKERKRKILENKKVELERERARLAELERELDDD